MSHIIVIQTGNHTTYSLWFIREIIILYFIKYLDNMWNLMVKYL